MMSPVKKKATVVFGLIVPFILIIVSIINVVTLNNNMATNSSPSEQLKYIKQLDKDSYEYTLYSLMYVEHNSVQTFVNKQELKVTVMLIGFAVISMGIMFIILGFKEENGANGIEGNFLAANVSFDFKTGSTGVAIFIIGALMVSLGGLLSNSYKGSSIPSYYGFQKTMTGSSNILPNELDAIKRICEISKEDNCVAVRVSKLINSRR